MDRNLLGQSSSSAKKRAFSPFSLFRRRHVLGVLLPCFVLYSVFVLFPRRPPPVLHAEERAGEPVRAAPRCVVSGRARAHSATLLLDNKGCRIPAHAALSAEVKQYVFDFPNVTCANPPPLVRSNDTAVFVEHGLAAQYSARSVHCCYTAMWRAPGPQPSGAALEDGVKHGNDIKFAKECVPFESSAEVPHEFIRVTCKSEAGKQVYTDFHGFVPEKRPRGHPGVAVSPREFTSEEALSVLIVGMDSLSRLNMQRKMPLTRAYLHELGAVGAMLGYNKVEDNTFPNLVPLLSGMNIPELRNACWPHDKSHFDACPWVWKRFNQEGYVNMFAEDTAWMGLFHYLKNGFANQPTDYDPRPLLYLGEKELGRGGGSNAKYCIGQRHQIEVLFDYSAKFLRAMATQRRKFFGLVWGTSLSHDLLNQPDEADAMYERFLRDLQATGVLNRTAVVFLSDHGLRFGGILGTYQGHLENLLPSMYFLLPEWARRRYPAAMANLECNRRGLVTLFDLHQTLHNFMDLRSLEQDRLEEAARRVNEWYSQQSSQQGGTSQTSGNSSSTSSPRGTSVRGISLFVPIPGERTCEDAGIPTHYCACQHLTVADPSTPDVRAAADFVVQQVNALLAGHEGCSRLALDAVLQARRGAPLPSRVLKDEALEHEFEMELRTEPGGALLSATVRRHVKSSRMQLAGSVSRLNAYGTSSWCANSTALLPFCYCNQPPPPTILPGR